MFRVFRLLILMALGILMFGASGCIFSPDPSGDEGNKPPPVIYPKATSKVILMDNFKNAYDNMDYTAYVKMLHTEYKFTYMTYDETGQATGITDSFEYSEEIRVAENMFSGNPGENQDGEVVGGISDITFDRFDVVEWTPIPPDDINFGDFEGAYGAFFNVSIIFAYTTAAGESATFTVDGDQYFVVAPFETEEDGIMVEIWLIVGQRDGVGL